MPDLVPTGTVTPEEQAKVIDALRTTEAREVLQDVIKSDSVDITDLPQTSILSGTSLPILEDGQLKVVPYAALANAIGGAIDTANAAAQQVVDKIDEFEQAVEDAQDAVDGANAAATRATTAAEQAEALGLENTIGQSTTKAMTQKAVTDELMLIVKNAAEPTNISYPTGNRQNRVTINVNTGLISSTSSGNDSVYWNNVVFNKGDVIHVFGSGSTARALHFGFTTENPAEKETLLGMQLTNCVGFAAATSQDHVLVAPYDGAYLLYHKYSTYSLELERYSLSSVKELSNGWAINDRRIREVRAVKNELTPDDYYDGYQFSTSFVPTIASANEIYCFYVDDNKGIYDYIIGYMGQGTGRSVVFFSSHEMGTANRISSPNVGYSPSYVKLAIPEGCKMVAVCVNKSRENKMLSIGLSSSTVGIAKEAFDTVNAVILGNAKEDATNPAQFMGGYSEIQEIVDNLRHGAGSTIESTILLYLSDPHANVTAIKGAADIKSNVSGIADVLSGGDNVYDQPNDAYPFFDESLNNRGKTMLTVVGNHDVKSGGSALPQKDVYDIYFGEHTTYWTGVTFPANAAAEGKCYWYKDYANTKLRLIGLDCIRTTDSAQNTWLGQVLDDAITNNYHVVICMHYRPYRFERIRNCNFCTLLGMSDNALAPSEFTTTVIDKVRQGLKFVCFLGGHHHRDFFGKIVDNSNENNPVTLFSLGIETPNAPGSSGDSWRYNVGGGSLHKEWWAYDLFSVNTVYGIVSVAKIGNNRDRFGRPINHLTFDYINGEILEQS